MEERITGKTKSGFEFDIAKSVIDDMQVLDAVIDFSDNDNPLALATLCSKILGADGKKKLYKHVQLEDGRVPIEAAGKEIEEIFKAFGETGKN